MIELPLTIRKVEGEKGASSRNFKISIFQLRHSPFLLGLF
jgi:hypothetical protein